MTATIPPPHTPDGAAEADPLATAVYGASPVNRTGPRKRAPKPAPTRQTGKPPRSRRTKAELEHIYAELTVLLAADHPMTLRGLFYQAVGAKLVGKTEQEYKNVGRYLLKLRRNGRVPYAWVSDSTRWMRKPRTHDSIDAALNETIVAYRRALWRDQGCTVEVWAEKDTLAGLLYQETEVFDVPLMVCKGFSSETYLYEAAEAIKEAGKPAWVHVLVDLDPSGEKVFGQVARGLPRFLPKGPEVHVERLALTRGQAEAWRLPTRPTKTESTHAGGFEGESVELDAIPAAMLRRLVRDAIASHIDARVMAATLAVEAAERATAQNLRPLWDTGDTEATE